MGTIKGIDGENLTVTLGAQEKTVSNYGTVNTTPTYFATALRKTYLPEAMDADSVEITSQPAAGRVILGPGASFYLDLTEVRDTTPLSFSYNRTRDGETAAITATVVVAAPEKPGGWGKGAYYLLETDASDAIVVEPGETTRVIHAASEASGGWTPAAIAAQESVSEGTVSGTWLVDRAVTGGGGARYGDETHPLTAAPARSLHNRYQQDNDFDSSWILWNRGDVFSEYGDAVVVNRITGIGESHLHPSHVGAWGSGDRPYFTNNGPVPRDYAAYWVIQDLACGESFTGDNVTALIFDNLYTDFSDATGSGTTYTYTVASGGQVNHGLTFRRCVSLDSIRDTRKGAEWAINDDRISGMYAEGANGILVERCFIDHAGWAEGYVNDPTLSPVKPPEDRSHGAYFQQSNIDLSIRETLFTRNSHSAVQFRPGGVMQHVFAAGNNTGINPANGPYDVFNAEDAGTYSLVANYVQTEAGFKGGQLSENVIGGGMNFNAPGVAIAASAVLNAGAPDQIFTTGADIGPGLTQAPLRSAFFPHDFIPHPTNPNAGPVTLVRSDYVISNWNRSDYPDTNIQGVSQPIRDGLTVGAYTDALLSTSGSGLDELCAHLRTLEAPWSIIKDLNGHFLAPFWDVRPRSLAQTVTFQPDIRGGTPGIRADVDCDWATGDRPGTCAGDSIDLAGHKLFWNINPDQDIADVTFGAGGELVMLGGALKPTGTITTDEAGNALTLRNGARFYATGYAGAGILTVDATDARILNSGSFTGPTEITAHYASEIVLAYDDAEFTLQPGRTLTVYGHAKVGFDGAAGGAASVTFATGSTVAFKPGIRLACDGLTVENVDMDTQAGGSTPSIDDALQPVLDSTVTGDLSGATGRVAANLRTARLERVVMLEDLSGAFADNETISGDDCDLAYFARGAQAGFATVNGTPDYTLGQIREFRTGINGFAAPDVVSSVTLGGTLHIDVTGLANGSYTLIAADNVTGAFDAVTAAGNAAKDLTLTVTGTQVQVSIANGTGLIL